LAYKPPNRPGDLATKNDRRTAVREIAEKRPLPNFRTTRERARLCNPELPGGRVRVSRERGRRWADAARQRVGWTDGAGYGRRVPVVALETVVAVVAVVAGVA